MITFVDTSILLDIFLPDPKFGPTSVEVMDRAFQEGSLIINTIIYAELAPQFEKQSVLDETLKTLGIRVVSLDCATAFLGGSLWQRYRKAGGQRNRILSDFLIGAHAQNISDRLLTRDRGFYRKYFIEIEVMQPEVDAPGKSRG